MKERERVRGEFAGDLVRPNVEREVGYYSLSGALNYRCSLRHA